MSSALRPSNVGQSRLVLDSPRTAPSPFDDPKADLIIRSPDNTLFYVHKSLLSIVSPVFEGMFALPDDTSQELYDDRPCLPVSDSSLNLYCLLRWCDPRCKRPQSSLDNLAMILEIADKYGMDSIIEHAKKDLLVHNFATSKPLKAFAIGIRFQLEELVQGAARATLRFPLTKLASLPNFPEFKHISASALHNLHRYHSICTTVGGDLLASNSWVQAMKEAAKKLAVGGHTHGIEYFLLKKATKGVNLWVTTGDTAPWWTEYVATLMNFLNRHPCVFSDTDWHTLLLQITQPSISLDRCGLCKRHGYKRLIEVSVYLSNIIDEAVSKIPFKVEY